jgi:hypothetical protein
MFVFATPLYSASKTSIKRVEVRDIAGVCAASTIDLEGGRKLWCALWKAATAKSNVKVMASCYKVLLNRYSFDHERPRGFALACPPQRR